MHKQDIKKTLLVLATAFVAITPLQAQPQPEVRSGDDLVTEQQPANGKGETPRETVKQEPKTPAAPPEKAFKPSEKVYADTVLTLPSDI